MTKKFRVWNNVQKIWINPDEIGISANGNILILSSQGESESVWDYDCWNGNRIYDMQQWTGLTDSQGVEIYEGDIVTYFPQLNSIEAKCEVVSCVGGFRLARLHSKKGVLLGAFVEVDGKVDSLKVIGNIFQNPELLEK